MMSECRPFKPKGGFKKDRREEDKPVKQQRDGAKHIDLKALRNEDKAVRAEGGNDKKKFEKKPFKKGGRPDDQNK